MEELAVRLPDGWTLVAVDAASGRLKISDGHHVQTLLVSDEELDELLEVAGEDSVELWAKNLPRLSQPVGSSRSISWSHWRRRASMSPPSGCTQTDASRPDPSRSR